MRCVWCKRHFKRKGPATTCSPACAVKAKRRSHRNYMRERRKQNEFHEAELSRRRELYRQQQDQGNGTGL